MSTHARVVIVGGGVMGTSLLYHLAREGWSDCVLLEKAELTSGSTWHAAGQITHSTSHYGLARMAGYAIELYPRLEAETGQSVTWHGCGSLRLAYTAEEEDWLRHTLGVGAALGHPMEIVGPDRIRELHPFYVLDGVRAALHTPADGHVDPAGATLALAAAARALGARIMRRDRVTGIERTAGGEWRVRAEGGDWLCEHVVDAGGAYARAIGRWVGLDLPVTCMTHHYLVTEPVPEFADLERELPVVRDDREVSGYVRQEQRSGLVGIYEKADPRTVWLDDPPWEAENELFDADWDRIAPWLEAALRRMPVLAPVGVKRVVHGAITHPPDGNMLLGPAPGLRDFWCCCGSQIGIAWGPGAGRHLAQWMVHGAADLSMRELDPRRYGAFADRRYAVEKAKEDYLLRHEIPYPGLDRPAARPVKTSALHARLEARGAVFEEVFGWERPRWFASDGLERAHAYGFRRPAWHAAVGRECRAVRERAGVADLSAFAKLDVTGADARAFLDPLVANRLPATGRIALAHLLNERGTVEAELTIARLAPDRFYLVCAAFFELRVRDWLVHRRDGADVCVENVSETLGCVALTGPRARDVLHAHAQAPLEAPGFPWLAAREIDVAGVRVRALRLSYAGELGWELHAPMGALARVYDAIVDAGETHGIADFGSFALDALRMEKGYLGARELTNEVTLPEAGMARFADLEGKDFVGREATLRRIEEGPRWQCATLEVDTIDADCHGGEAVLAGDRVVGAVSSGTYGHAVAKSLAHAFVAPGTAAPGTDLAVMVLGEPRPARVLGAPPLDPANERLRA